MSFQLIIIGGGISGVAVARDASQRGIRTLLVEKETFGAGASSKTSKLAHGGLRYLENFEFGLVRESLRERNLLIRQYPDLVKPLSFLFPVYRGDKRPFWMIRLGLYVYDVLSLGSPMPRSTSMSKDSFAAAVPGVLTDGLNGVVQYFDAQMDDLKLVEVIAEEARASGATLVEQARVTGLLQEDGRTKGVILDRDIDGLGRHIQADCVANITGPWTDEITHQDNPAAQPLSYPTKGAHLIVDRPCSEHGLILPTPQDQRVFFILPYQGNTLIGTTDTPFNGNPDQLDVSADDRRYLLDAASHYFPSQPFDEGDIVETYVGLRPLVAGKGEHPSQVSRELLIHRSASGLYTLLGGKYTTHRAMADALVRRLVKDFRF